MDKKLQILIPSLLWSRLKEIKKYVYNSSFRFFQQKRCLRETQNEQYFPELTVSGWKAKQSKTKNLKSKADPLRAGNEVEVKYGS